MGQALYRKYRSRGWDQLVGQQHVAITLQNAVKSGRISHAYLFSGPRGVGKTSVARILARQINELDYLSDEPHIDIIEIDAASNTSVDDIRDLKEKASVAPALAKYKIYIIDEVHMLSKSAFNALLKTLEEPPAHVIFMLATTDPQKLPDTIISRTQHFAFQPIARELAVEQLKAIAKAEKIKLDNEAADLIAELGEGSLRDSLSLLDQLGAGGEPVTPELVAKLVGLPPEQLIETLATAAFGGESKKVIGLLAEARISGYQAVAIASRLGKWLQGQALESGNTNRLTLAKQLLSVASSQRPEQLLEIILLETSLSQSSPVAEQPSKPTPAEPVRTPEIKNDTEKGTDSSEAKPVQAPVGSQPTELWTAVLDQLRGHHNTLYGIARMARPSLEGDTLTLELAFPFHLKRLNETKNRQIISKLAAEQAGRQLTISVKHNTKLADNVDDNPPNSNLGNISSIFGGGELLES